MFYGILRCHFGIPCRHNNWIIQVGKIIFSFYLLVRFLFYQEYQFTTSIYSKNNLQNLVIFSNTFKFLWNNFFFEYSWILPYQFLFLSHFFVTTPSFSFLVQNHTVFFFVKKTEYIDLTRILLLNFIFCFIIQRLPLQSVIKASKMEGKVIFLAIFFAVVGIVQNREVQVSPRFYLMRNN